MSSKEFLYLMAFIISLILGILSWRFSNNFISRRETYHQNNMQIFFKKLGLCLGVFLTVFFFLSKILKEKYNL